MENLFTNAELAILTLLIEKPMHGYEIEQTIEDRGMREWTELGFSSIYYLLNKLKKRGVLKSRLEAARGKGPAKQVFFLTKKGESTLKTAIINAIAKPSRSFSSLHLGLANSYLISKENTLEALEEYATDLRLRYQNINKKWRNEGKEVPLHAKIIFDLSLTQIHCELNWVMRQIGGLRGNKGFQLGNFN